jgi:type IV pilus assembly protein PilM
VSGAIRTALEKVSPRGREVTLTVPDTAVRVVVLDFDALPARAAEADPMLRMRLRKMVPFDVERAKLSYQILVETKTECKVLAVMMPGPILAEYEAAVRAAGYEPGAVLPSSLAALAAVDSQQAVLMANLSGQALVTVIANGRDILLYRTINLPADPTRHQTEVRRSIGVAVAYYEDKLLGRPRHLHFAGEGGAGLLAGWLGDPELEIIDLVPRWQTGTAAAPGEACIAGVTGALAGAN